MNRASRTHTKSPFPRVAVLLPCRNESLSIRQVVREFRHRAPRATIWVYDNNSTDPTAEEARQAGACVGYEPVQGKGAVVQRMFDEVDADIYVLCDGDGTYALDNLSGHLDMMLSGAWDMLTGVRQPEDPGAFPPGHRWGNRLFSGLVSVLYGHPVGDLLSGYRLLSHRLVKSFRGRTRGFEVETELTLHAIRAGARMASVPVGYRCRPEGSVSKLSTWRDGWRILKVILSSWTHWRAQATLGHSRPPGWPATGGASCPEEGEKKTPPALWLSAAHLKQAKDG
jgi:glycosyltransferase involved in cell wall biosynthesis